MLLSRAGGKVLPDMGKKAASKGSSAKAGWKSQAEILRVLAHPVRLTILEALSKRSQCVKDLNTLVPMSQAHFSQHMAALRRFRLIACHANGPLRCYYLARPTLVRRLVRLLREDHPVRLRSKQSVLAELRRAQATSVRAVLSPEETKP